VRGGEIGGVGKTFFIIGIVPRGKELVRHDLPRKERNRKADQKVKQNAGGIVGPTANTLKNKKPAACRNTARELPSPEKRQAKGVFRFSFLDAEEKARLSMPSFLASSEKRQQIHNTIVKHRKAKQQRERRRG
jgi:hypothetical protein